MTTSSTTALPHDPSEDSRAADLQASTATATNNEMSSFVASYTVKDVLLYALAVGYGDVTRGNRSNVVDDNDDHQSTEVRRRHQHRRAHPQRQQLQRYERDLMYVYENHPHLQVLPTFCLALSFLATTATSSNDVRSAAPVVGHFPEFPPPVLRHLLLGNDALLRSRGRRTGPILHTWQSIVWNSSHEEDVGPTGSVWDVPLCHPTRRGGDGGVASVTVSSQVVDSVVVVEADAATEDVHGRDAKSGRAAAKGTWVTTKTVICQRQRAVCEMKSKFLIVGNKEGESGEGEDSNSIRRRPSDAVEARRPLPAPLVSASSTIGSDVQFTWTANWHVGWNAAVLYRLGSGDTNSIHVVGIPNARTKMKKEEGGACIASRSRDRPLTVGRPIVHGLCTMGHIARMLSQHYEENCASGRDVMSVQWKKLECRFVNPVFVGDELQLRVKEECVRRAPRLPINDDDAPPRPIDDDPDSGNGRVSVEVTFQLIRKQAADASASIGAGGGSDGPLGVVVVDQGYAELVADARRTNCTPADGQVPANDRRRRLFEGTRRKLTSKL